MLVLVKKMLTTANDNEQKYSFTPLKLLNRAVLMSVLLKIL